MKELTFTERQSQRVAIAKAEMDDDEPLQSIVTQNEFHVRRYGISLPRDYGRRLLSGDTFDQTTWKPHGIDFPATITPRDDRQERFFSDLHHHASMVGPQDILAIATTGSGKSVAGIHLGQLLGVRTLIVVDQNKIANGWIENNMWKFYGQDWCNRFVGRVQQDRCDYMGVAYSVAMAQTLARREYDHDFYRSFSLIVFDEIQVFGAPHFAKLLGMFPARVRVGFTAEERSGGFRNLVRAHLGRPRVVSKQEVMQPICYMLRNQIEKPFYCENDGAVLTGLSRVESRNTKLAKLIVNRGYNRGRNVLVLSDRTNHLFRLMRSCIDLGCDASKLGLHVGSYESERYDICYETANGGARKFHTVGDKKEAAYYIRRLEAGEPEYLKLLPKTVYNRLQKGKIELIFTVRRETIQPSQNELDHITDTCQIIFATYQIFSKGVDVPRLDMGVEALPSGNVKQPLGRILRLMDGKPMPEWYAIDDRVKQDEKHQRWCGILNSYFKSKTATRVKALEKAKARISYQ